MRTEEVETGYTVTGAVWPGEDVKRRAVIVVAEAARAVVATSLSARAR